MDGLEIDIDSWHVSSSTAEDAEVQAIGPSGGLGPGIGTPTKDDGTRVRPRRTAGLLLLPLVLVACATAGPAVRSLGPAIPVPASPTPDASNTGPTLLIRLDIGYQGWGGRHTADYLSDGTVIRWTGAGMVCAPGQPCGALERNTLTAEGLAALRALLAKDADLLGRPGAFEPQVLPGRSPSGRPNIVNTFVREQPDGSRSTVNAPSATSFDAPGWAPTPAVDRLNALAATLVDPAALVGPGGLTDPTWTPYTPELTAVFIRFIEIEPVATPMPRLGSSLPLVGPLDGSFKYPDISDIGWPFAGTPDTFGSPFTPAPSAGSMHLGTSYRCAVLSTTDAVAGIGRLPASTAATLAAGDLASGEDWVGGGLRWSGKSPSAGLSLAATAILPEDVDASCADLFPR